MAQASDIQLGEDIMGYLTVALVDGTTRFKLAFRSTSTSVDLAQQVCYKLGIKQPHFFGLKRLRNPNGDPSGRKVWLSERQPVFTQGVDSSTTLYFRHKYWWLNIDEITCTETAKQIYEEVNRALLADEYENTEDVNIQLAALRLQMKGDYNEAKPLPPTEEALKDLLPPSVRSGRDPEEWAKLITVFHQKHKGKDRFQARLAFLELVRDNTQLISTLFFPATYGTREMQMKMDVLIGLSPEGVGFFTHAHGRKVLRVFLKYTEISSWTVNQLWNGQEAPDYNRSHVDEEELEKEEFPLGPYRADLYLHTTVARAKEVEFELSSFLPEDDTLVTALEKYNVAFQMYGQFMDLDGTATLGLRGKRDTVRDRVVQISSLDGNSKKLRLASDMTGQDLINAYAEKIGMTDTAFFQLSEEKDGADRWLSLKEPVMLQGIAHNAALKLKLRFFFKDPMEITDPVTQMLYFMQVSASMVCDESMLPDLDAAQLAALYLQATQGDHEKKRTRALLNSSLNKYIPPSLLRQHGRSWWEKKIVGIYEKLRGLSKEDAVVKYLKVATSQPNYGFSFFPGIIPSTEEECTIGISKLGLSLFKSPDNELLASYRFGYELRSWSFDGEVVNLRVKPSRDGEDKHVSVLTLQFAEIIDLLSYYDRMRRLQKQLQDPFRAGRPSLESVGSFHSS